MNAYTITKNPAFNSLEISFTEKPAETVREALKALKFRWHSVKKVWYGYTDEETARAVIEGKSAEAKPETKPAKKNAGTAQDHIRIYYNGIKIDGGKLTKCFYSIHNPGEAVTIYADGYGPELPRDLLEVKNDTDIYTDYFDTDSATVEPSHSLYRYFEYAAAKAERRTTEKRIEYLKKCLSGAERWPGQHDGYRADLERLEAFNARFDAMTDPGQPTAEDLEAIDRARQEAENARREAEHRAELEEREKMLRERNEGRRFIESAMNAHPVEENAPTVEIPFSEYPAFYSWTQDRGDLRIVATVSADGSTDTETITDREPRRLVMSLAAAEIVLKHFDIVVGHRRGYYKTDFVIRMNDENGEECTYSGRYDLGDGDGGLIAHIRACGEWSRTHTPFGAEKAEPDETNTQLEWAEALARFVEAEPAAES